MIAAVSDPRLQLLVLCDDKRSPDERSDIRDFHMFLNPAYRCAHAGYLLLTTVGTGNARRLCPLDTNLLQCPNSPGTEELPR
jgi:hypothetical protein